MRGNQQSPRARRPMSRLGLSAMLAMTAWSAPLAAADYKVLVSGVASGSMTVSDQGNERQIAYSFIDRGRGPELQSSVATDAQGYLTRLSIRGVGYYKLPVDERFSLAGQEASWTAANDSGTAKAGGFYFPDERTPEHVAILARALLRAPGGKLPLIPGGEAEIEQLSDLDLQLGGRTVRGRLYAISGLTFAPVPIWLDPDGELLMEGNDWFATVRTDLEQQAKAMLAAQQRSLTAAAQNRTARWLQRPATPTAFVGVAMFDSGSRTVRHDMTVIVEGNRIVRVGKANVTAVPVSATVIDGKGKTLLPGLWDMHVHLSNDVHGALHLAAGVTSVRDLANNADELAERRRLYDAMEIPGPRVVPAGFIDGPGPLAGPIKVLAATPGELRTAIQSYADRGYKAIKLYSSLDPKLVPVAVEEARRLGMRVSGHVPAGMRIADAVAAGFDEVHHINFVALNFMGPDINAKSNGMARITALAEHGWEIDPASPQVAALIGELRKRGTVIDPTVALFEDDLLGRAGEPDPGLAKVIDRLPPVFRRGAMGGGLAKNDVERRRNARSYEAMLKLVKALHDGGVQLVAGTDERWGFNYHRELEAYEQAGIARTEILYIATLGAAKVVGLERELGSIEEGKAADLLLVSGDPAARISDIRNTVMVMKNGVPINPDDIYRDVGVRPAVSGAPQPADPR